MNLFRSTTTTAIIVLACFALWQTAYATGGLNPPPDGGYANRNTAEGDSALFSLTTGDGNTAVGFNALYSDTSGSINTAIGRRALLSNTTGVANTAVGATGALHNNTTGSFNTAVGLESLFNNTTGSDNAAIGDAVLQSNIDGNDNLGVGDAALVYNTSGDQNLAVGTFAGGSTTGSRNTSLGFNAGVNADTGSNNIDIGNQGVAGESNTIRIGAQVAVAPVLPPDYPYSQAALAAHTATFIAGISGTAVSGSTVVVNANGQLGVRSSSQRFKEQIKPMDKASEAILALKPVTFHYKKEIDANRTAQFGLVAEDVAKVNPDLVARDAKGEIYTVRYEAVNAMLLNEFLKEHKKVEEQQSKIENQQATISELKSTVAQQQKGMEVLTAQLKEQAAQIQKVSAQFEVSKPAPQTVLNNQ